MNELELKGFMGLINKIKEKPPITISEYFDICINKALEENINEKWFMKFKAQIEDVLKRYAIKRNFSVNYILKNNRVERTENSLIILLGKEIKYKDKIFELFFPSEFNENFVLVEFCIIGARTLNK